MIGIISKDRVSSAFAKNLSVASFVARVSLMRIGLLTSNRSASFFASNGIVVPWLFGTDLSRRHSWLMTRSSPSASCSRSQRSAPNIRPTSETTTFRNRSRSMSVGRSRARRSMIASRASCMLILRSSDNTGGSISIFINPIARKTPFSTKR